MKIFGCVLFCLWILRMSNFAFGLETAPIEWEAGEPSRVWGDYESHGMCRFIYSRTFHPGEVKLNITFDRVLTSFNDYDSWLRLETRPGVWYYSQSISWINPGFEERVDFKIRWSIFEGRQRPDGVCVSNVGTAIKQIQVEPKETTAVDPQIKTSTSTKHLITPTLPSKTPTVIATLPVSKLRTNTQGCSVAASHGAIRTKTVYATQGQCKIGFDTDPMEGFGVNVTFDKPVIKFDDFGSVNRVESRPGLWYYGTFLWKLNSNEPFMYDFTIQWEEGDVPLATCYVDVGEQCEQTATAPPQLLFSVDQAAIEGSPSTTTTTEATTTTMVGATEASTISTEEIDVTVEWLGKSSRKPSHRYFEAGGCEFLTNRSYEAGEFYVNVTFDSRVADFKISESFHWEKQSHFKDHWYYYVTKFPVTAGQSFKIDFSVGNPDGKQGGKGGKGKDGDNGPIAKSSLPSGTCQGIGLIENCKTDIFIEDIKNETESISSGTGRCTFRIFENVTTGELNVNVTFDGAVLTFMNRDVLSLNTSSPGKWYFSESLEDYFIGDTLTYKFDVTWDTDDVPYGTCSVNVACNDFAQTDTST